MRSFLLPVHLTISALIMSGCSDVRQKLGLEAEAPDEYMVYDRAPLSVPPKFGLRPPQPGALRPQETSAQTAAQKILNQDAIETPRPVLESQGKSDFLEEAGIQNQDPNVRTALDQDIAAETKQDEEKILQDVLFWQKKGPKGKVIDPVAEKKRLASKQ